MSALNHAYRAGYKQACIDIARKLSDRGAGHEAEMAAVEAANGDIDLPPEFVAEARATLGLPA